MNSTPAANDPIVRMMRDGCARFTHTAENAGLLAPLLLMLAEALAHFFGKLENIFLLWRAGELPPPAPRPIRAPRARTRRPSRPGRRRTGTARRTPALRPRRARAVYRPTSASRPDPSAPSPRIDRYPKPTLCNRSDSRSQTRINIITKQQQ